MNFAQLKYLVSLHKLKHFGKAAKENFVTQPTLSMMIKKLEDELNVEIFDRSSNPIKTTTLGLKIIDQATKILNEHKQLINLAESEIDSFEGELSIAFIPTLAPYVLPLILPVIQREFPKLSLSIIEKNTDEIINEITANKLDLAILATPLLNSDIVENHLYQEAFYLYTSENRNIDIIAPSDIDMEKLILLEEGHCLRTQVLNLCQFKSEQNINTFYKIGSIETIINLVNQNQGSTIIPELAIHHLAENERKRVIKMKAPVPVRQISLVHHYTYHKKKLVERLVQLIDDTITPYLNSYQTSKIIPI